MTKNKIDGSSKAKEKQEPILAKPSTKANEAEYEVHADGVQVRVRIVSYDNTTREVVAKALVLVEEAFKRKKKEVAGRDVA